MPQRRRRQLEALLEARGMPLGPQGGRGAKGPVPRPQLAPETPEAPDEADLMAEIRRDLKQRRKRRGLSKEQLSGRLSSKREETKGLRGELKGLKNPEEDRELDETEKARLKEVRQKLAPFRPLRQEKSRRERGGSRRPREERPFDPKYQGDRVGKPQTITADQLRASKAKIAADPMFDPAIAAQGRPRSLTPSGTGRGAPGNSDMTRRDRRRRRNRKGF